MKYLFLFINLIHKMDKQCRELVNNPITTLPKEICNIKDNFW